MRAATSGGPKPATSQLALPADACDAAFAEPGYGSSVSNLARLSLASDLVVRDGWSRQLGTMPGDVGRYWTTRLTVPV